MTHLSSRLRILLGALWIPAALLGALASGGGAPASAQAPVGAVATIPPLADVVGRIGGELVEVESLLAPGASPHTFEPRPGQVRSLARAKLVVGVGAGLDDWALRLATGGSFELVLAAEEAEKAGLALPSGEGGHDHGGEHAGAGHSSEHGAVDPHVWLDPVLVRDAVAPAIAEALVRLLPGHEAAVRANLEAFQRELDALDREVRELLGPLPSKTFIGYHSAWAYFARRYGLQEVASVAAFPGQEPSARWVASVVEAARRHRVRAIFTEPQLSPKAAEVIAAEIGGVVLLLDPLGGTGERRTYVDLIRYNARAIASALGAAADGEAGR